MQKTNLEAVSLNVVQEWQEGEVYVDEHLDLHLVPQNADAPESAELLGQFVRRARGLELHDCTAPDHLVELVTHEHVNLGEQFVEPSCADVTVGGSGPDLHRHEASRICHIDTTLATALPGKTTSNTM